MNKRFLLPTVIVLILVALALIFSNQPQDQNPISIGFLSPLTGPAASVGQSTRLAAEIAVEKINQEGGIDGQQIKLIIEDSKCDPKESTTAATKLMNVDQVVAIIGDLCSSGTLALAPIAEQNKTIVISHGSTNQKISESGDYIFRDVPSDAYQGIFIADYAYKTLGKRKAAVFHTQEEYAQGISTAFSEAFKKLGGEIVFSESASKDQKDFRVQLQKIKSLNPDMLYTPLFPSNAIPFYKQAKEFDVTAQIVSTDVMEDATILGEAKDAAEGIIYTTPYQPDQSVLEKKMKQKDPEAMVVFGTPQAYDAVKLLADVIDKVGTDSEKIKNELYNISYDGLSGKIEFDKKGDLREANYSVIEIKNGNRERR